MSRDESFLSRWSRLKRTGMAETAERATRPPASPANAVPKELPSLDSLDFSSDFSGFLRAEVEEKLKSAALKKLFHSPHFNEMDGLDVYIDDYNKFEPLTEDTLRQLNQARGLLFAEEHESAAPEAEAPDSGIQPEPGGESEQTRLAENPTDTPSDKT